MEETVELVPIKVEKVMPSRAYTCVVLHNEEKKFALYTDANSGKMMQMYLTSTKKSRPFTPDLLNRIFMGLNIKIKQVVITEIQDTIFFARLFVEQQIGDLLHIVEIDARPSDCITFALAHKIPVYCTKEVLEKAVEYID